MTSTYETSGSMDLRPAREVVALSGDYDLDRERALCSALLSTSATVVVADMSGVSFVDASALRAFLEARGRLELDGRHLVLEHLRPGARRLFEITSLVETFGIT